MRQLSRLASAFCLAAAAALVPAAGAGITVQSIGTAAPPATIGPYAGVKFPPNPTPIFTDVTSVDSPSGGPAGVVAFSAPMSFRRIGSGWATWSHGYTGDVYYTNGATSVTMTMPTGTQAFQFFAEPNPFGQFTIDVEGEDNQGNLAMDSQSVEGLAGANGWDVYASAGFTVKRVTVKSSVDFAVGEFAIAAGAAPAGRASTSQKGSVLIFPKWEVAYATQGDPDSLTKDTFIQISNDLNAPEGVHVITYSVRVAADGQCVAQYTDFDLTHDQPVYFRASTGAPVGVAPFSPAYTDASGYFVVIATNLKNEQIRYNHLTGLATIVDYSEIDAWEYHPYAFQGLVGQTGDVIGNPGTILLDGFQYDSSFNRLNLDFMPVGATAFSGGGSMIDHDTELALLINDIDVRQENQDYCTKVVHEIWDGEEHSFKAEYCICCWDCSLLSTRGPQFTSEFLNGHIPARSRIDGVAATDAVCGYPPGGYPDATDRALLGVAAKVLTFSTGDVTKAGSHLVGQGNQAAVIYYDLPSGPEEGGQGAIKGGKKPTPGNRK